jgi:hypothetical protein
MATTQIPAKAIIRDWKWSSAEKIIARKAFDTAVQRDLDRTFDYRYSILPFVFAALLREARLSEDDLLGLALEKLDTIVRMVQI